MAPLTIHALQLVAVLVTSDQLQPELAGIIDKAAVIAIAA